MSYKKLNSCFYWNFVASQYTDFEVFISTQIKKSFVSVCTLLVLAGCAGLSHDNQDTPPGIKPFGSVEHLDSLKEVSGSPNKTSANTPGTIASKQSDADLVYEYFLDESVKEPNASDYETLPTDTHDLWERIRQGFRLPELDSPLVSEQERLYLQKPEHLERMFARAARYLHFIVEEVERRSFPMEVALLPFVESAMNPKALSPAKAAGLWQFIPSTGKAYNLTQDWWSDERRDVVESTQAALEYIQKIYELNNSDWFRAFASYNLGEGAVARAVKRNQARGLPIDYLSLGLPKETRNFVPKLLAIKHIVLNAQAWGVQLPEVPNRPYFVTINKMDPIDLSLAAKFAGMSVADFLALNPEHNRPVISAGSSNTIKLPADRMQIFLSAVANHSAANRSLTTWSPHTLTPGETLERLARQASISVSELRRANDFRAGQRILPGTRLLVPNKALLVSANKSGVLGGIDEFSGPRIYELVQITPLYHRVSRYDTLSSIANKYAASVNKIQVWNGISHGRLPKIGSLLLVRPSGTQTVLTREDGSKHVIAQKVNQSGLKVLKTSLKPNGMQSSNIGDPVKQKPYLKPKKINRSVKVPSLGKRLASDTSVRHEGGVGLNRSRKKKTVALQNSGISPKVSVRVFQNVSKPEKPVARLV